MTIEEIREQKEKLDQKYSTLFWNIEENKNAFSKPQYDLMQQHLHELYTREYALLFDEKLLSLDKQIEQQKITRTKEMAELEKQHTELIENIEREKRQKALDRELEDGIAAAIDKLRREEVLPVVYPNNWWRKLWRLPERKNRAQELAERQLQAETDEYFEKREGEVEDIEARAYGAPELADELYYIIAAELPQPRTRRGRRRQAAAIRAQADELAKRIMRKPQAEADEDEQPEAPGTEEPANEQPDGQTPAQPEETQEEPGAEAQESAQGAAEPEEEQTDGRAENHAQDSAEPVQTTIDDATTPE